MLSEKQAEDLVVKYIAKEGSTTPTQEILDSGAVPRLAGYITKPGKVSDSIFGGKGSYYDKKASKLIEFENPPIETKDGILPRLMVRNSKISTHDITRGEIPFKDQILAENHNYMLNLVKEAIGTSQYDVPGLAASSVVIAAENLQQIPLENVLRAYMAKSSTETSLYHAYIAQGKREFAGHSLPKGLAPNGILPYVMDTPSTKSDEHDMTVAPDYLFKNKICTPQEYQQIRNSSIFAFGIVSNFMKEKGIILVDTKTEHGKNSKGEIVSQDELYTLDSSRFWLADDYNQQSELFYSGNDSKLANYLFHMQDNLKEKDFIVGNRIIMCPKSYSKEFARGFSKGDAGYTDEQRVKIAVRYIMGIQHLLGKEFEPDMRPRDERVITGLQTIVDNLVV